MDNAKTDEEHEFHIGLIRKMARAVDIPIFAGGRVKRLEDVKKYLYAGAKGVFLDASVEENVDMIKEAADRFGSEKIFIRLNDAAQTKRIPEYAQLGASMAFWERSTSGSRRSDPHHGGADALLCHELIR